MCNNYTDVNLSNRHTSHNASINFLMELLKSSFILSVTLAIRAPAFSVPERLHISLVNTSGLGLKCLELAVSHHHHPDMFAILPSSSPA